MTILLACLCLITVMFALLAPTNHRKQTQRVAYAPIFAFLSLLLGFTFSQFLLWHTELSELRGRPSITFSDQSSVAAIAVSWLCGLYFTTQPDRNLLRRTLLFLLSSAVLIITVETAILIGRWADESGGGGGNIAVNVTGLASFITTVWLGYRLARSFRRDRLLKRSARVQP